MKINDLKTNHIVIGLLVLAVITTGIYGYSNAMANKYYEQGVHKEEGGFTKEAKKDYEQALRFNPRHADANYQIGCIMEKQGNVAKAKELIQRAVELDSDNTDFNLGLGFLYFNNLHDTKNAKRYFSKALTADSKNYFAAFMMGKIEESERHFDKAIYYYKEAVKYNPKMTEAYRHIALLYEAQGAEDKAKTYWNNVLKLNPQDKDAKTYLESGS